MYNWGDENVDWNGINNAADFISDFCRKWGRLGGQSKEKYGTVRFYARFDKLSLHTLIYPGYVYNQFPDWLWKLDCSYLGQVLRFFFEPLFQKWRTEVYNIAYQKALKKWPHLRAEILCSADFPEIIKGVTRRDGKDLHILGWNGEILSTWTSS